MRWMPRPLLHEFAHLMVRVSGVSDLETDAKRPPEDQRIEVFCNHVAAAALIPREALLSDPRVIAQGPRCFCPKKKFCCAKIPPLAQLCRVEPSHWLTALDHLSSSG